MRIALVYIAISCSVAAFSQNVGDIAFDPKTDDPKFQLCNPNWVLQSYQLKTIADETSVQVGGEFRSKFVTRPEWEGESGIIRVRFIVNCNGLADRFRLLELGFDLKEKKFNEGLRVHVLQIAKGIQWPARRARQQTVDHYHYFTIRIADGQLRDIIQ